MSRPPLDPPGTAAAIGGTPLVRLDRLHGRPIEVWAKLEALNPGGSAKDRTALAMLTDALETGALSPGGTVIESSSGNLGMALARLCRPFGVNLVVVVDDRANPLALATIRALGAEVQEISPAPGEDRLAARVARVRELLAEREGAVTLDQYSNPASIGAHANGTMREIMEALDGRVDVVFVATSTTGTLRGCEAYVAEHGLKTRLVAVDAVGSVLFGGHRGDRLLTGFGAGFVCDLAREATPSAVRRASDLDCVVGCRVLAEREGILAGASGGGVVHTLLSELDDLDPGTRAAIILHDGGTPYLGTVYDDDWVAEHLGTPADSLAALVADAPR